MSERIEEIKQALAEADASLIIKAPDYISYLLSLAEEYGNIIERQGQEMIRLQNMINKQLKELETKDFTIRSLEHNRALLSKELEEAQETLELVILDRDTTKQNSKQWEKAFDNADKQYLKMEHEAAELRRQLTSKADKLVEAQQTIARQRETLDFYGSRYNHEVKMEDTNKTKIESDGGSRARSIMESRYEFDEGQSVIIIDGFAHIGDKAKVVTRSVGSGGIINYQLDSVLGSWPQSSLRGESK